MKSLFRQRLNLFGLKPAPAPSRLASTPDVMMAKDAFDGMPFWKVCDLMAEVMSDRPDVDPRRLEKLSNDLGTQAFLAAVNS